MVYKQLEMQMLQDDFKAPLFSTPILGNGMGLLHGDAMELICDLEDESVDLTILDPNYQD